MLSQGFNYKMKGAEASAGVISRKKQYSQNKVPLKLEIK